MTGDEPKLISSPESQSIFVDGHRIGDTILLEGESS